MTTAARDISASQSPQIAPVIDTALELATKAQVIAALSYLGSAGR